MNELNRTFMTVLRAALKGESASGIAERSPQEWQALFALAQEHSVLPMFYEALHGVRAFELAPAPLRGIARQQTLHQVMLQTMKTSEFFALYEHLTKRGVRPLVVKGVVCRNLYPKPDNRPSGDEDILIPAEQFEMCHEAMLSFGMQTGETPEKIATAYEVPYGKQGSALYIELHKHLFPPESEAYGTWNRFFEDVHERAVEESIQGMKVYTLAPTDHLFYLICHAFKHFLHSGFGIRQVCDIAMYAAEYGAQVDWQQVLENCQQIHADVFAATLFAIGEKHLGFSAQKACYPEAWRELAEDETAMLEDLLSSGIYGASSMSRKHSSNITLDAVAAQNRGKKAEASVRGSLFPSAKKLEGRYPYLKKWPVLLPVAWVSRIAAYLKESGKGKQNSASETIRIGSERVELLRKYKVIE